MLGDWLERLLTTCPVHLRDMGCLREMLGIRRRRRRFRDAWEPHCLRSRRLILDTMSRCTAHRRALVLGSGWLHDVPLDELAGTFEEVVLVDLFHPLSVRRQLRRRQNVRLVAADVTGTLEQVWRRGFERGPLPESRPMLAPWTEAVDLTVSLNLLSQLPVLAERYLLRCRSHSSDAIFRWGQEVIRSHLAFLERLPGVVALITDVAVTNRRGQVDTLFHVELPYRGETWEWDLVPGAEHLCIVGVKDIKDPNYRLDSGGSA